MLVYQRGPVVDNGDDPSIDQATNDNQWEKDMLYPLVI